MARPELGILVPGQGTGFNRELASLPGMRQTCDKVQGILPPDSPDVWQLLNLPVSERPESVIGAHLVLTAVAGHAAKMLGEVVPPGIIATVSGHSAGLPACLAFTKFYAEGVEGLAEVMRERARLLMQAQEQQPGVMHAVYLKKGVAPEVVMNLIERHNEERHQEGSREEIWIACINFYNEQGGQLVLTSREDVNVEMVIKKELGEVVKKPIKLSIAVGAHSPLVFEIQPALWSFFLIHRQQFVDLAPQDPEFVSDHLFKKDIDVPVFTREAASVYQELATLALPVEFQRSVLFMVHHFGVREFWEIGSHILTDMIRQMPLPAGIGLRALTTPADFETATRLLANLGEI